MPSNTQELIERSDDAVRDGGYLDGYEAGFQHGGNEMRRYINGEIEEMRHPLEVLHKERINFPGIYF